MASLLAYSVGFVVCLWQGKSDLVCVCIQCWFDLLLSEVFSLALEWIGFVVGFVFGVTLIVFWLCLVIIVATHFSSSPHKSSSA